MFLIVGRVCSLSVPEGDRRARIFELSHGLACESPEILGSVTDITDILGSLTVDRFFPYKERDDFVPPFPVDYLLSLC